jgi:hypothetical protein
VVTGCRILTQELDICIEKIILGLLLHYCAVQPMKIDVHNVFVKLPCSSLVGIATGYGLDDQRVRV